jgi:hypothetical protein
MAACCVHGHETSSSIEREECFEQLSEYWIQRKEYSPRIYLLAEYN